MRKEETSSLRLALGHNWRKAITALRPKEGRKRRLMWHSAPAAKTKVKRAEYPFLNNTNDLLVSRSCRPMQTISCRKNDRAEQREIDTYRGGDSRLVPIPSWHISKPIALESQQPMHIPNIPQIILPSRLCANAFLPRMYELEYAGHDRTWERRRTFRKATDELVQKLFCCDLEVECVSAGLDEGIEECECEHGYVGVPVVHESGDEHRGFSRSTYIHIYDTMSSQRRMQSCRD